MFYIHEQNNEDLKNSCFNVFS